MSCTITSTQNKPLSIDSFQFECTMSPPEGFRLKPDLSHCSKIMKDKSEEFIGKANEEMKEYTQEDAIKEFNNEKLLKSFQSIANLILQHDAYLKVLKESESEKKSILNFDISSGKKFSFSTFPVTFAVWISIDSIRLKDFLSYIFFIAFQIIDDNDIDNLQDPKKIANELSKSCYTTWIDYLYGEIFYPTFNEHCIEPLEQNKEFNPLSSDPLNNVASLIQMSDNSHKM